MKDISIYVREGFYRNAGCIPFRELEEDFEKLKHSLLILAKSPNLKGGILRNDSREFNDLYLSTSFRKLPVGTILYIPNTKQAGDYYKLERVRDDAPGNLNAIYAKWKHVSSMYGDSFVIYKLFDLAKRGEKFLKDVTIEFPKATLF